MSSPKRTRPKSKVANCDLKRHADPAVIKELIFTVRGQRVMLDRDLADLYGVTTKRLNQQLRRNRHRFPKDFAFRLTLKEAKEIVSLRLQNATLKKGQHIKYAPHVFTEHGAIDALEEQYDGKFKMVFAAIRQLITAPNQPRPKIGFVGGQHEPS